MAGESWVLWLRVCIKEWSSPRLKKALVSVASSKATDSLSEQSISDNDNEDYIPTLNSNNEDDDEDDPASDNVDSDDNDNNFL